MAAYRYEILGDSKVAIVADGACMDNKVLARKIAACKDEKKHDGAFFVVNLNTVVEQMLEWKQKLPRVQPFYAVKCNNDPVLLKVLADLGAGFDCASRAEINQIVEKGLADPSRVLYANPCKTRSFIQHANQVHVNRMTFDSAEELVKIKDLHTRPELILRIAVCDPTATCPLSVKFGCEPLREGPKLLKMAKAMEVPVVGISFHVGSGCNDPKAFREAISLARQLFDIGRSLGHDTMYVLDIGGGFPGYDTERISFDKIVAVISPCIDEYFPVEMNVDIIAEPGRFFGSAPVSLVTNVIATTKVPASRITMNEDDDADGFMYYMNDGVYGSFNCILFDHVYPKGQPLFDCRSIDSDDQLYPTTIWGPTCDGLDKVEEHTEMRKLSTGDWLYYSNMGAYTLVASSNFNGFESPKPFYVMDHTTWESMYGIGHDEEHS